MRKTTKMLIAAATAATMLTACSDEADTVSHNISKAADNFEVLRRVVFFNGITDTYLLSIEGYCNITDEGSQLEVVCKTGDDAFEKHFLGLSDNVSYFAEQMETVDVDAYHHRVTFRPETIVPDIDLRTSDGEGN